MNSVRPNGGPVPALDSRRATQGAAPANGLGADEATRIADILQAAARIFCEKGFHATSIHEIAEAVHLTKAGLYYYITGKQDLLFGIMDYAMQALESQVVAKAQELADPVERLRAVVRGHTHLVTQEGSAPFAILVNELEGLTEQQRVAMVERQRCYIDFIREILEEIRVAGRLLAVDPTTASFSLLGMILWTSRWFRPGGRLSAAEVVDQVTLIALSGVLENPLGGADGGSDAL